MCMVVKGGGRGCVRGCVDDPPDVVGWGLEGEGVRELEEGGSA
jgi:hypothetical protein